MKTKFLSALAVAAFACLSATAQDAKPKFFLEDGKVVERFAAVESDVSKLKADVAALTKTVADLKAGIVTVAESGPGELGTGPVTIPLTPIACNAPGCPCPTGCTCVPAPGGGYPKCPAAVGLECPSAPIQFRQVCENGICKLVPVSAPTACYAPGQSPSCPTCPQAAPQFSAPAAGAFGGGRPVFFPRAHGFFQAHRPHLFGRLFGGCCGG